MEMNNDIFTPDLPIPEPVSFEDAPIPTPVEEETPAAAPPPRRRRKADAPVLTIESGDEIETEDAREAAAWHEIHNAYRTRRILSAPLGGIEQTDSGKTIAVVDYNGFRIVIPLKEMMVMPNAANSTESMVVRQMKLLGNMLGAEIDFVILGIDSKTRSVVASRREAMMRKRQLFYFSPDANGEYRVREGRVVQARVIAVADKSIRVEIFGVECSIMARDLAWDWIGDAHDRFAVGDQILVRVTEVNKTSQEELSVRAYVKSVTENTSREALKRCRVQSKYAGRVTDVHKGIVYVRLSNGVNAVAHSCYDRRTPGKKDDVSFVVTKLDEERSIAVGIITRIIRQNVQEFMVWSILNWRILREEDIGSYYEKMANNSTVTIHRSWQDCVQRLLVRGLIVVGAGDTEYDALYDLLACRFIIPIGAAWPLRVLLFLKLTFLEGISWKITRRLFHVDARSVCEKKVIRLARQTSLSCAEIIKCIEMGIRRLKDGYDVLDKLYDDNDLNCDNFAQAVREYHCSREVITAVVNLYLRQQIMIDTY